MEVFSILTKQLNRKMLWLMWKYIGNKHVDIKEFLGLNWYLDIIWIRFIKMYEDVDFFI